MGNGGGDGEGFAKYNSGLFYKRSKKRKGVRSVRGITWNLSNDRRELCSVLSLGFAKYNSAKVPFSSTHLFLKLCQASRSSCVRIVLGRCFEFGERRESEYLRLLRV